MKNDFDFIREKIENSDIKAPESLSESAVRAMLEDKQPAPIPLRPKRRWPVVAAAAAAFVIVATLGVVLGTRMFKPSVKFEQPSISTSSGLTLKTFGSYKDVEDAVAAVRKKQQKLSAKRYLAYNEEMDAVTDDSFKSGSSSLGTSGGSASGGSASGGSSSGGASTASFSETYKQVEGVDEADIIKTDGRYIYCVENRYNAATVKIFSADGDSSRLITTLDASKHSGATADEAAVSDSDDYYYGYAFTVSDMYLSDHTLVLLCMDHRVDRNTVTKAQVYDVSDINSIRFLGEHAQSGYLASSRMIGDTLYTVSSYYPYDDRMIPCCDGAEIDCGCIYAMPDPDTEGFLVVSAYNTRDLSKQTRTKALLGAVEDIYCNEENLYIYASRYEGEDNRLSFLRSSTRTQIVKMNLTDGLNFSAFGEVRGYIDDQYALDEYNGNLRVATTSERDGKNVNNLFVLDENLSVIGSVTGFAEDESIKAVRYMGDTAYVITYEETDPLFVIDLSDPVAPAILGEAKISGFSTMLVPIGDDLVLGLGYHTEEKDYTDLEVREGVKLALFDVSDRTNPKVLDSKSFVDYNSEVQYNPKALVYNPDRDDYIIPLNYAYQGWPDYEFNGGMLNFSVENGKIKVIDQYRSDKMDAVERCIYVGDTVYMTHHGKNYEGDLAIDTKKYQ